MNEHAKLALESLQKSVAEALERKLRLGQYAVVWQDGKIVELRGEELAKAVEEAKRAAG